MEETLRANFEAVDKMTKPIKTIQKQLKQYEKLTDKIKDVQLKIKDKASATLDKINQKMKETIQKAKELGQGITVSIKDGVTKGLAGIGAGLSAGIGVGIASTLEETRQIQKYSAISGMSSAQYQQFDYLMKSVTGGEFGMEQAIGDIAALAEKAGDAMLDAESESAIIFKKLGVSVTDANGKLKSQAELFDGVVKGLAKMEDVTARNAIATALMSTTGEEIAGLYNKTATEIEQMKSEAVVFTDKDLQKFSEFQAKWENFKNSLKLVTAPLGTAFAEAGMKLIDTIKPHLKTIGEMIPKAFETISTTFNIEPLMKAIKPLFDLNVSTENLKNIMELLGTVWEEVWGVIGSITPIIGDLVSGALNLIGSASESLINTIKTLGNIFESIFNAIRNVIKTVSNNVKNSIKSMGDTFNSLKPILNGVKDTFSNVFNGIKNIVNNVKDGIVGAMNNVKNAISGALDKLNIFDKKKNEVSTGVSFETKPGMSATDYLNKVQAGRKAIGQREVKGNDVPALLHDGERVLTARDSRAYDINMKRFRDNNKAMPVSKSNNININISVDSPVIKEKEDIDDIVNRLVTRLREELIPIM